MTKALHALSEEPRRIPTPLILYDGVCRLCTSTVLFVIKRDRRKRFRFASMQSPMGQRLLRQLGLAADDFKTFVLVEPQGPFIRSTAALRVAKQMDGWWPGLYVLIVVPTPIRDRVYDWVAKHRYRWFGRLEECLVPTSDVADRFVDGG